MSQELSIGKLGAVAPFKAKEGTITMTKDSSAQGSRIAPVHSAKFEEVTRTLQEKETAMTNIKNKLEQLKESVILSQKLNLLNGIAKKNLFLQNT